MANPPQIFQRTAPVSQNVLDMTPLGTFVVPAGAGFTPVGALVQPGILGNIADVQSIWCDASAASDPVFIRNAQTRQYVIFPPGASGIQNLLLKKDANQFEISCLGGASISLAVSSFVLAAVVADAGIIQSSITTPTRVDVNAAVADTLILAANAERQGYGVWLEGAATFYLLNGTSPASTTNYSVIMQPGNNYFESPFRYGGEVRGFWSAAVGGVRVTEYL